MQMTKAKCSEANRFYAVPYGTGLWAILDRDHADKHCATMDDSGCHWHGAAYWTVSVYEWREAIRLAKG